LPKYVVLLKKIGGKEASLIKLISVTHQVVPWPIIMKKEVERAVLFE
jgi:hypothetical protein